LKAELEVFYFLFLINFKNIISFPFPFPFFDPINSISSHLKRHYHLGEMKMLELLWKMKWNDYAMKNVKHDLKWIVQKVCFLSFSFLKYVESENDILHMMYLVLFDIYTKWWKWEWMSVECIQITQPLLYLTKSHIRWKSTTRTLCTTI
jgi:hypothetical protein